MAYDRRQREADTGRQAKEAVMGLRAGGPRSGLRSGQLPGLACGARKDAPSLKLEDTVAGWTHLNPEEVGQAGWADLCHCQPAPGLPPPASVLEEMTCLVLSEQAPVTSQEGHSSY